MLRHRALVPAALAALALAAAGCGGDDDDEPKVVPVGGATTPSTTAAPTTRNRDGSGRSGGSDQGTTPPSNPATVPGQVTLTLNGWWRQMRYRSAFNTRRYYTPRILSKLPLDYSDKVFQQFGLYAGVRSLIVDEVRVSPPDKATAFLRVRPEDAGESRVGDELVTIRLRKVKDKWLIDDKGWFDEQVRAIANAGRGRGLQQAPQTATTPSGP